MMKFLEFIGRVGNVILDAINKSRKKDAADNPSGNIANGGNVVQSDKSYADLAGKSGSDKTE